MPTSCCPLAVVAAHELRGLRPLDVRLVLEHFRERLLDLRLSRADLRLGLTQLRLRQLKLGLDLFRRRLEWTRVDLEQEVAGLDHRALLIVLAHEVAADTRADLRVDVADERADPLR